MIFMTKGMAQSDSSAQFLPKYLCRATSGITLDSWHLGYQLPTYDNLKSFLDECAFVSEYENVRMKCGRLQKLQDKFDTRLVIRR
ncbi:hypothetical protein TNIN_199071 [Trichonephila inaurata madagascariensis]|uniref:Uncharacterized protein n=1 Tax=Trichonephila inaurata madagascariensis TaxID=2747483 RepID=A0A8X6YNL1_9ARAC|nr:hypothetical protein TNIN_199071 [Trichonephila inaurata madagascariensis]